MERDGLEQQMDFIFILNKWCIGTYEFTVFHTSASVVCDAAVIHYFAVESVYAWKYTV